MSRDQIKNLKLIGEKALFLSQNAANTTEIKNQSVNLIITSPPFLDVVDYAADNWLRCWFNNINLEEIKSRITTIIIDKLGVDASAVKP